MAGAPKHRELEPLGPVAGCCRFATQGRIRAHWGDSGLREAEDKLGRTVNASVYTPSEFAKKIKVGNHTLGAVLGREKLPHDWSCESAGKD